MHLCSQARPKKVGCLGFRVLGLGLAGKPMMYGTLKYRKPQKWVERNEKGMAQGAPLGFRV